MNMNKFPKTGQRLTISALEDDMYNQENQAIPANAADLARDEVGFTNPNLHRRIRENVLHDGKKVYTITEPFTTGSSSTTYNTKYPIGAIKYVYISSSSIRPIYHGIKYYWVTSTKYNVGDTFFKFKSGYAPAAGLPMEVIYETIPLLDEEVTYRDYELFISGVHSYRTTKITLHTEEDEGDRNERVYENEIP